MMEEIDNPVDREPVRSCPAPAKEEVEERRTLSSSLQGVETIAGKLNLRSADIVIQYFTFGIVAYRLGIAYDLELDCTNITMEQLRTLFLHLDREYKEANGAMPVPISPRQYIKRLNLVFEGLRRNPKSGKTLEELGSCAFEAGIFYDGVGQQERYHSYRVALREEFCRLRREHRQAQQSSLASCRKMLLL